MKLSTYCLFVLCLNALALQAQDFVVPDDGDFVAAINAANNRKDYNRRFTILVKAGTHVSNGSDELISTKVKTSQGADSTIWFPSPIVTLIAPKVTIMGEGRDKSIVENRPTYEGISITSTLFVDGADSELISSANLSVRTLTSDFTQEVRFGLLSKFYASESPMSGPGYAMSNVKVE